METLSGSHVFSRLPLIGVPAQMVACLVTNLIPRRALGSAFLALAFASIVISPAAATTALAGPGNASTERTAGSSLLAASPEAAVLNQKATRADAAYEEARERVQVVGEQSARLDESAEQANATAQRLHEEVRNHEGGTLLGALARIVDDGESDVDRAAEAARDAEDAAELAATAKQALADAITETERARLAWESVRSEVAQLEAEWTADEAARSAAARAEFRPGYRVDDEAQDARNRKALRRWQSYLFSLADAAVVPPAAKKLTDPDRLPQHLDLVRDDRGRAVPGVAETDGDRPTVSVLSSETIRAVSAAFSRLGLPEVPGAIAPSTYACGGFLANAWGSTTTLAADSVAQWRELRTVPMASLQVGDVVVLGSKADGLGQSGVYLGKREMIVADPETGTAGVQPLPRRGVYGAKRVNFPVAREYDAPQAGACGVETTPDAAPDAATPDTSHTTPDGTARAAGTGPFVLPVASGAYSFSAVFGATSSLWSSGSHTGQDFAASVGTPVVAAADGVVTVERPGWAGNLVRIDHGGGVETWYAHLSEVDVTTGQQVRQGQVVGAVGREGNSTGPHLHFEVRLDGAAVDPALVLELPERPRPTSANGEVPETALCAATTGDGQLLRCDAAVSYRLLNAAYTAQTGAELCITDSYRSRAGQEHVFRTKPGLAAIPGTSVHGWGLAVDLCGGVERFGTAEHNWMLAEGPAYGWHHPSWAGAAGSRPEPWHFEYAA